MGRFKIVSLLAAGLMFMGCGRNSDSPAGAASDPQARSSGHAGANPADGSETALTPEDQGASKGDQEITRQIRQTITSDSQFSTEAKNVKVVTVNGKVTLRGPVSNVQEQRALASIARHAPGVESVDNQLEVKNNNNP